MTFLKICVANLKTLLQNHALVALAVEAEAGAEYPTADFRLA